MVKIFVGTSVNGEDDIQEKILEYSLRKHCTEPIEITFMRNNSDESNFFGNFKCENWATPFSGLRWAIPEYCNFSGRAIYMDVDQLSLSDISELYNIDMEEKMIACAHNRTCIMLIDCEKIKPECISVEELKKNSNTHMLMYRRIGGPLTVKRVGDEWNCLDGRGFTDLSKIKHLHFTAMPTQPWKPAWFKGTPREHGRKDIIALWEQYKAEAFEAL